MIDIRKNFYSFIQSTQNANKKVFTRKEAVAYLRRIFPLKHYGGIDSGCDYGLKQLLDINCIKRIGRGIYEIIEKP